MMPCWSALWYSSLAFFWGSGVLTIASASFLFSVGTLGVKWLEGEDRMPSFEVACIPSLCCSLLCTGILLKQRDSVLGRTWSQAALNVLRGVFGACALVFFYLSVDLLPLKDAVTLFFTSPMIAVFLEWAATGIFPGARSLLGCVLTVAGVVLVTQTPKAAPASPALEAPQTLLPNPLPSLPISISISPGVACSLAAATANAISFVIVQALHGRSSSICLTWWYHTFVTLGTAAPLTFGYPSPPFWPSLSQHGILVFIVVCQLLGQIFLNRGFSLVSATKGAAINVLQVLFSYIWELLILHEAINLSSAAGGALVTAGVVVVALSSSHSRRHAPKLDFKSTQPVPAQHLSQADASTQAQMSSPKRIEGIDETTGNRMQQSVVPMVVGSPTLVSLPMDMGSHRSHQSLAVEGGSHLTDPLLQDEVPVAATDHWLDNTA